MARTTTYTTGTTTHPYRPVLTISDLCEAVADGYATVLGAEDVSHPKLVDVRYAARPFHDGGIVESLMRMTRTSARTFGCAV